MESEWDEAKSTTNFRVRGFGFDHAALVFSGPTLETPDNRRAYGEVRVRAIGAVDADVLVVVCTDRSEIAGSSRPEWPTRKSVANGNRS